MIFLAFYKGSKQSHCNVFSYDVNCP